jgi:hypothetical protein
MEAEIRRALERDRGALQRRLFRARTRVAGLFFRHLSLMLVAAVTRSAVSTQDANDGDAVLAIQSCGQLRLRLVRGRDDSAVARSKRRWSLSENQAATPPGGTPLSISVDASNLPAAWRMASVRHNSIETSGRASSTGAKSSFDNS